MNLTNYYWYFKSAIPERICDDISRYGKQLQDQMAVTGGYGDQKLNQKQVKDLKKKRNSDIVWMSDRWVYKEIQPYIHSANANAGWNFQWDYSESCQFTKYTKGQFYDWHCDSWDRPYIRKNTDDPTHGKIRKLSVTINLSDPKDYDGGVLEFNLGGKTITQGSKAKGAITVFPSYLLHRVSPVTRGTRKSLVLWVGGNQFR